MGARLDQDQNPAYWRWELARESAINSKRVEIVVFLVALVGYWGMWRRLWLPFLLPVVGTFQLFMIGDTDKSGGWVNGLHGLFPLIVLLLAAALVKDGTRSLRASGRPAVAS